jgi:HTH-type transcriptional regulator/antitoxin MqsA
MKIEKMACPLCGSQKFYERDDHAYSFKQGRKTHIVDHLKHHACDDCDFSIFTPQQQDFNNQRVQDFQACLEDFISPAQVLALREKYLITQTDANKIFGGGPTAFSKYERGVTSPSAGIARQMLRALESEDFMYQLADNCGVKLGIERRTHKNTGLEALPEPLIEKIEAYAFENGLAPLEALVELAESSLERASEVASRVDYAHERSHQPVTRLKYGEMRGAVSRSAGTARFTRSDAVRYSSSLSGAKCQ